MNHNNTLHLIILQPTDVLFFRDGRPMEGSLAGHTAAWPLPNVINHAFHAALHRAGLSNVHLHRHGKSGEYSDDRDRKFGCLTTAGPFPLMLFNGDHSPTQQKLYLPCPLDIEVNTTQKDSGTEMNTGCHEPPHPPDTKVKTTLKVTHLPVDGNWRETSSLPQPLLYPVANQHPPTKETSPKKWISSQAYQSYLNNSATQLESNDSLPDSEIAELESTIGIAIDPATGTTGHGETEGKLYIANYLRLRENVRMAIFAQAIDKEAGDLIHALFKDEPQSIIVGGQQRLCTAQSTDAPQPLPLPIGLHRKGDFNKLPTGKYAVKWVLLSPAIWPAIPENQSEGIKPHPGGWLPNWVCPDTGSVLLKAGNTDRQKDESRDAWRKRVRGLPAIHARLVAALVPKPIVVTGWALPNDADRPEGGAKSTHLAVPPGAVYYFEADSAEAAAELAAALNWHGDTDGIAIKTRRSTLLGEKGYGLGVCGTWQVYRPDRSDRSNPSH